MLLTEIQFHRRMKESFKLIHHEFPIDSFTIQITIVCYVLLSSSDTFCKTTISFCVFRFRNFTFVSYKIEREF